jgi:hypothetical protein
MQFAHDALTHLVTTSLRLHKDSVYKNDVQYRGNESGTSQLDSIESQMDLRSQNESPETERLDMGLGTETPVNIEKDNGKDIDLDIDHSINEEELKNALRTLEFESLRNESSMG